MSLPASGSSADSRVTSAWAAGLVDALAMPTIMPTAAAAFASTLYPFTAAPLSPARPYCDLRHRIFLSEVNLGFKEFLWIGYFQAIRSGGWSGPVAGRCRWDVRGACL